MECCNSAKEEEGVQDEKKIGVNKRLETIGWGLFLVMIGGLMLVPEGKIPEQTWLVGVGLIMLGINGARYFNRIKMDRFTNILGVIALVAGIVGFYGGNLPIFPILLILIGIGIIGKPLLAKKKS